MTESLAPHGLCGNAGRWRSADLVLLNTCHIREKAAEKVYSDLGRIRDLKASSAVLPARTRSSPWRVAWPRPKAPRSRAANPAVDLVVGPQSYHRLGDLIARTTGETPPIVETDFPEVDKFALAARARTGTRTAALS